MPKIPIVIDPGHGGSDPGAVNEALDLHEADANLRIALVLKAILDTHGCFEAILTRQGDVKVPLAERTKLANDHDAILVSIHCNAATNKKAHGAEVLCFAKTAPDGSESLGHRLAQAIQTELVRLDLTDRGVKPIYDRQQKEFIRRRLWVLRKSKRPAVLVECAFVSNAEEGARLADDRNGFKEDLAKAIFIGIERVLCSHRSCCSRTKEVSA